jgi:4-amino-4-deoxy-L-arabinose transferase-like glycosyltransferase
VSGQDEVPLPSSDKQRLAPSQGLRWGLTAAFVILWLFSAIGAYFWAHKPLSVDATAGLARTAASLIVWLLLLLAAAGLGRHAIGRLLQDETTVVRLSLSIGVGLGMLSLTTLALGILGWLTPLAAWLVLGLAAAGSWRQIRASLRDMGALRIPPIYGSRFLALVVVYASVSLGLALLLALTPPTGWDALVYHLTGPRLFVDAGQIVHTLDLPYLGFPQLGEMLFALGMLLLGDGVAPLIHYIYGLLATCLTAALTHRFFGGRSGWYAGLLLLSVPTLLSLMGRAYVDVALLFYVSATLYAFLRWQETRDQGESLGWLLLAAALAGLSAGVKYTAIGVPLALGAATLWVSWRSGWRSAFTRLAAVIAATTVVAAPWLLENWLTTGNPVYPFLFGGHFWDSWRSWWYDRPGTGIWPTQAWRLFTASVEASVLGAEGSTAYDATIGPLILMSIPLLGAIWSRLIRRERSAMRTVLIFFGISYALWLLGLARSALLFQTRLLLPTFGAAAVIGGVALDRLSLLRRPQLAVDWIVRVAISLTLVLLLLTQVGQFAQINPLPVVLGIESQHDYLSRRLGVYPTVMDALTQLPPGSNVVFLWEPRSYGCLRPEMNPRTAGDTAAAKGVVCQPDALLDRFLHLTHQFPDAAAIAHHWQSQGVTYVLLHQAGLENIVSAEFDPVTSRDLSILATLLADHLRPVKTWGEAYTLYELRQ